MANQTFCFLNVYADSASEKNEIKEFLASGDGENKKLLDFEKVLPLPESLNVDEEDENSCYNNDIWKWCWKNWGTKSNAGDVWICDEDDEFVQYEFVTAWTEPDLVIKALSKRFPNAAFEIAYSYADATEIMRYDYYVDGKITDWYKEDMDGNVIEMSTAES